MTFFRCLLVVCALPLAGCSQDRRTVLHTAAELEARGQFAEAAERLESAAHNAPRQTAFPSSTNGSGYAAFDSTSDSRILCSIATLPDGWTDLSWHEFASWVAEGRFDTRLIEDTLRFFDLSRRNLFWRYPQLNARRMPPPNDSVYEHRLLGTAREIIREATRTGSPLVLPPQFSIRMQVVVDAGVVPAGELVRVWLPIPRQFPHQRDFELLSSTPPSHALAPDDAPARAAYFENPAPGSGPILFEIAYRFTAFGVRYPMRPEEIFPYEQMIPSWRVTRARLLMCGLPNA